MTGKTKIALCLSGEPRSSMFCFPYIYESFINLPDEYEVDVYVHSWKNFRALKLYNPKESTIQFLSSELYFLDFINNLNIQIENLGNYTLFSNTLRNSLLMFTSINRCFNLIQKRYDVYIRSRLDFYFPSFINIEPILIDIIDKKYDMFIPKSLKQYDNKTLKEYNDQLAIGNFKSTQTYSNIINDLPKLISDTKEFNTQKLLRYYLDNSNLNIKEEYMPIELVRQSNIITNEIKNTKFLDQ